MAVVPRSLSVRIAVCPVRKIDQISTERTRAAAAIAATRASQTASDAFDHAVADYAGLDRTAYRCLDILDQGRADNRRPSCRAP